MSVAAPGAEPIVFDLGTGLRFFGDAQGAEQFRAHALVTHLHWDHVQGLPFCPPIHRPGSVCDIYGPGQEGLSLHESFEEFMRPPYFPVRVSELIGQIAFHTVEEGAFAVGDAKVTARYVPHIGPTLGYRVELGGRTVAYISDHQQPLDGSMHIAPEVLELADGVDLLIHDAQYTAEEFAVKGAWGHCTIEYAVHVAAEAGARRLALFHHDPAHTDDVVDRALRAAQDQGSGRGLDEVIAASEGLTVALPAAAPAAL